MDTVQTPPKFTEDKLKNLDYTADTTDSLPKIPNLGDTLEYTVIGNGTGAAMSLDHGVVSVWSIGSTGSGSTYIFHVTVTNIGSSNFLVIVHGTGYRTMTVDSTNDYATTNITATLSPVQASGKYFLLGA